MTTVSRLFLFTLLSLSVHILALQFEVNFETRPLRDSQRGVGFVARPAEQFYLAPTESVTNSQAMQKTVLHSMELSEKTNKIKSQASLQKKPVQTNDEKLDSKKPLERSSLTKEKSVQDLQAVKNKPNSIMPVAQPAATSLVADSKAENTKYERPVSENEGLSQGFPVQTGTTNLDLSKEAVASFIHALPRYDINPLPKYPEVSRRRGQQGTVQLEVLVLADGRVGETELITSSGFKSLDRAAVKAVRRWKFKPATALKVPVESRVLVPVDFVLNSD